MVYDVPKWPEDFIFRPPIMAWESFFSATLLQLLTLKVVKACCLRRCYFYLKEVVLARLSVMGCCGFGCSKYSSQFHIFVGFYNTGSEPKWPRFAT
jgi:hypothetical protein